MLGWWKFLCPLLFVNQLWGDVLKQLPSLHGITGWQQVWSCASWSLLYCRGQSNFTVVPMIAEYQNRIKIEIVRELIRWVKSKFNVSQCDCLCCEDIWWFQTHITWVIQSSLPAKCRRKVIIKNNHWLSKASKIRF